MAEGPKPTVFKNVALWRSCENLYLDIRTADVFFIFKSENGQPQKLPAHKNILASSSPVFDAMFFGEMKEKGDVKITDTSIEVFKEFLQFFYLSTIKLSAENIAEVMNLGKQYLLNECFTTCVESSKEMLTSENMCSGYELAILFEDDDLKKFCEEKISEHAEEVFRSSTFLTCGSNLLRRILQLNSLDCDETVVFDGCMKWAKASCIRKGLDEDNMQNIRSQLGDLLYEIRFGEMNMEKFYARYNLYENLFSKEDLKCIMGMIASKEYSSGKFNRNARIRKVPQNSNPVLVCNRVDPVKSYSADCYSQTISKLTAFETSDTLLLTAVYFNCVASTTSQLSVTVKIVAMHYDDGEDDDLGGISYVSGYTHVDICSYKVTANHDTETVLKLPRPVVITKNVMYGVIFESKDRLRNFLAHKSEVDMGNVRVKFHTLANEFYDQQQVITDNKYGLLTQLHFQKFVG